MREIKFRALYEGVWYYQTLEEILTITLAAFRNGEHKTQYTGLKDKNGKEIYEGDIIKCNDYPLSDFELCGEVVFINQAFRINSVLGYWAIINNPEIIGNIYENPELIR